MVDTETVSGFFSSRYAELPSPNVNESTINDSMPSNIADISTESIAPQIRKRTGDLDSNQAFDFDTQAETSRVCMNHGNDHRGALVPSGTEGAPSTLNFHKRIKLRTVPSTSEYARSPDKKPEPPTRSPPIDSSSSSTAEQGISTSAVLPGVVPRASEM